MMTYYNSIRVETRKLNEEKQKEDRHSIVIFIVRKIVFRS